MSEQSHSHPPDASSLDEEAPPAAVTETPRPAPARRAPRRSQAPVRPREPRAGTKEAELELHAEAPVHADVRVRADVPTRVEVVAPPDLGTITHAYVNMVGTVVPSLWGMRYHAHAAAVASVMDQLNRVVNPEPRSRRTRRSADS